MVYNRNTEVIQNVPCFFRQCYVKTAFKTPNNAESIIYIIHFSERDKKKVVLNKGYGARNQINDMFILLHTKNQNNNIGLIIRYVYIKF